MSTTDILDLLSKCSLTEKKFILEELLKDINKDTENSVMQSNNPNTPVNYEHLISYSNNFIEDDLYLKQLLDELESLNLYSLQSARPSTMSLSLKNNNYDPRSRNLASQDLNKYPALFKLRELVNQHSDVGKELDCCSVVCLSNDKQSVRLHADNESSIDQSHPIATVSLGVTRKVEFVPFGSSYDCTAVTVQAEHNSLYVMKPGTQSILQHRVVRGNSKELDTPTRYSISFRKHIPDTQELMMVHLERKILFYLLPKEIIKFERH